MAARFSSFAQNFEDVILWRALRSVDTGFYVDIGAAHPTTHSVSRGFYEQDWRGIHVEPNPELANELRAQRPDETVIEAVVGPDADTTTFHVFPGTGLSTGVTEIAERHTADGREVDELELPSRSLASILDEVAHRDIHWLKIDVEGMERTVLESWGTCDVRPWIVVIEATEPLTTVSRHHLWESEVVDRGYQFAYFDGLNRFYVHQDHADLMVHFGPGPNLNDRFTVHDESAFADALIRSVNEARESAQSAHEAAAEQNRNFSETLNTALGWSARVDALGAEVGALKEQLHRLLDDHAALDARRHELEERLAVAEDGRHHAESRAHAFEAEAAHLREIIAVREHRIDEILASTSWKVSRPVRALGAMRNRNAAPPAAEAAPSPAPAPPVRQPPVTEWTLGVDDDTLASFNDLLAAERNGSNHRD